MVSADQIKDVQGGKALDGDGGKIGSIGQIYLNDRSGQPEWATVHTGLFGTSETFIPLHDAHVEGNDVRFPYTRDKVKEAPRVDADQHLDVEQEQELYEYYGVSYEGGDDHRGEGQRMDDAGPQRGREAAGGTAAAGIAAAGNRESDPARMRKYVTTEEQTVSVTLSHEEVHVERVPVADGTAASDDAFQEFEQHVTLHEEVPVVTKEAHAVDGREPGAGNA